MGNVTKLRSPQGRKSRGPYVGFPGKHGALLNPIAGFPSNLYSITEAVFDNLTGEDLLSKKTDATVTSTAITLPTDANLIEFTENAIAGLYYNSGIANTVNFADIYENYGNQLFSNVLYTVIFKRELTEAELTDFYWWFSHSVFDTYSGHAEAPLALTSPYIDLENSLLHPSVVYFPSGWNGYKYWMVCTPLPQGIGDPVNYENPSLYVSNDSVTWAIPDGVTNPIVPYNNELGWNSDPYLYYENDTLYCIFRKYIGSNDHLYYTKSNNGITWDAATLLKSAVGLSKLMSPSIVKRDNTYYLFVHEAVSGATVFDQNVLVRYDSSSLLGEYANRTVATYNITKSVVNSYKANTQFFHTDIQLKGNVLYALPFSLGTHVAAGVHLMKSYDMGLTWLVGAGNIIKIFGSGALNASKFDLAYYKSALVFDHQNKAAKIIYTGLNSTLSTDYQLGVSSLGANKKYLIYDERDHNYLNKRFENHIVRANQKLDNFIFADDFVRADTVTTLGTSSSGDLWENHGTQYLIIKDNTAQAATTALGRQKMNLSTNAHEGWLIVNIANADGHVFCFKHLATNDYLIFTFGQIIIYCSTGIGGSQKTIDYQLRPHILGKDNEIYWWTPDGDEYKISINGYLLAHFKLSTLGYIPEATIANWVSNKTIALYTSNQICTYKKILVKSL